MRYSPLILSLLLLGVSPLGLTHTVHAAGQESIATVVNHGVITTSDLNARMSLIAASSGLKPSKDMAVRLRNQVLNMLIDEEIRNQEAKRLKIEVSDADIDKGFAMIAQQNNMPPDQFKKMIQSHGININTMRAQIKSQLAWTQIVQKQIRPRVEVSEADIDNELERLKERIGKDQYLVGEIFIPVTQASKSNEAAEFAGKLAKQLQSEPDAFPKAAKQFSAAPGADKGGIIGWVMAGQLPEEVDAVIPTLALNTISNPIKTTSGIYIVVIRDKRQLTADKLPTREDITERLGMERLDRAAKRYFIDLRNAAFVEKRG